MWYLHYLILRQFAIIILSGIGSKVSVGQKLEGSKAGGIYGHHLLIFEFWLYQGSEASLLTGIIQKWLELSFRIFL